MTLLFNQMITSNACTLLEAAGAILAILGRGWGLPRQRLFHWLFIGTIFQHADVYRLREEIGVVLAVRNGGGMPK